MRRLEDDKIEPYLGGYNSANAHFIQVTMSTSPELYRARTFKETLRNFQDLLVTGGINTNIFLNKKRDYRIDTLAEHQIEQVTFVVNTRDQALRVSQFFREYEAPQVKSVKVTAGKEQIVIEEFEVKGRTRSGGGQLKGGVKGKKKRGDAKKKGEL